MSHPLAPLSHPGRSAAPHCRWRRERRAVSRHRTTVKEPRTVDREVEPHTGTRDWCRILERIWHGQAAAAALAALEDADVAVFLAPMWLWTPETTRMPGKPLPIRLSWSPSPVFIVDRSTVQTVSFTADSLGVDLAGTVELRCGSGLHEPARIGDPTVDGGVFAAGAMDVRETRRALQCLVDDGVVARWDAVGAIEPILRGYLRRAHTYLSHDMSLTGDPAPLLSDETLEELHNELLLGEPGAPESMVFRLLGRAVDSDGLFARVDPLRWLHTTIRREAQEALRGRVGDSHIGSRIRAVARDLRSTDVDAVMSAYRARHRTDLPGPVRVASALKPVRDPMAWAAQIDDTVLGGAA